MRGDAVVLAGRAAPKYKNAASPCPWVLRSMNEKPEPADEYEDEDNEEVAGSCCGGMIVLGE